MKADPKSLELTKQALIEAGFEDPEEEQVIKMCMWAIGIRSGTEHRVVSIASHYIHDEEFEDFVDTVSNGVIVDGGIVK